MKLSLLSISLILLLNSCSVKNNTNMDSKTEPNMRLHDIWALDILNDRDLQKSTLPKRPTLEIYVADKRVVGNDGCNNIAGPIELLTATELKFGALMGTRMACPDMEISNEFNQALTESRSYKLDGLKLKLFNGAGQQLIQFRKID